MVMSNCVLSYVLLSIVAGFVFPHAIPNPHEKPPEWEQPVVITEEFFPPHHPPHPLPPHNQFKEIIGIELQRIPFHPGPEHEILEHERHKEHEILEHRKHEILEHEHGPHLPPDILEHEHQEHEILSHELPPPPPPGLLEHEHHPHGFHDILEHEHRELEHREHEHREHERREHEHREHEILEHEHHHGHPHEHPHEHEILEHEHREHDIMAHEPHEPHLPPWEDPDFVLSEEEHHHEHENEFHHEELFPEVPRRRTNRRREGGSREGGSRRSNSNSNRRENSNRRQNNNNNRRENSNRQGNNNRREGSNREGSRRNGINTEELFPRRNRQNNNNNRRNNNNNNRRNNNNRENSRRNSNIEELAALEEEIMLSAEEMASHELSRPERDVNSYYNNDRRDTSIYQSSPSGQNEPSGSQFERKSFPQQQDYVSEGNQERRFANENSRSRTAEEEEALTRSRQRRPGFSNLNDDRYPNNGFSSGGILNQNTDSGFNTRRPEQTSGNIFVQEEEYLTLDGNSGRPSSGRPTTGGQSNTFGSNRPETGAGESSRPSFLGSRPGSGKPLLPGSQESSRPNRPGSSSSGFYTNEEDRPNRPNSGSSGIYSNQENFNRPNSGSSGIYSNQENFNRPNSGSSGIYSNQESFNRPNSGSSGIYSNQESFNRPNSGSTGLYSNQENFNRPNSGSTGLFSSQESRPNRPGSGSSGIYSNQESFNRPSGGSTGLYSNEESRPNRPNSGSSGLYSNNEDRPGRPGRPNRPSTGSSGDYTQLEERPSRPGGSSSGHFSNQENSRPSRPSNSHFSSQEQNSRPHRPSGRPDEESSKPRPSNGNNPSIETDLISRQEDSWLWPNQSQDGDKQNRRAPDSGGNKKQSTTTKRPNASGNHNNKKQHANLKLLPTDSCGVDLGNKIIGGENTQLDEFPWMALLQHSSVDGRALGFGCGGSLISPRYVLTAAHCIKGPAIGNNVRVTKVRLGEFDTSSDVDCQGEVCSPPPVDVPVEEIIVHPKYRATDRAQLNDIALIRLKENVKTSGYISPICLPIYGNKDYVGEKLTVAGWGKTSNGQNGASSKTKQKVSIPVVTLEECSPFYNRINIQLNNTQMCAGGERGKDSCQGDSGGPLMGKEVIDNQVRWQVHGVVSFGPEDCGIDNVAGVYTRVSEYINWILDNMKR